MSLRDAMARGPYPDDGWGWLYEFFSRSLGRHGALRRALCAYFWPKRLEMWAGSKLYRTMGVRQFGRLIPTGGILIRRITKSRMAPYTLSGTSVGAARAFFYRTCVFESLHLPFLLVLLALAVHQLLVGRPDLALEDSAVNLVANIYPIMHHRHTRARIIRLLSKRAVG